MKNVAPWILVVFLLSGLTGTLFYISEKKKYLASTESLKNEYTLASSKFKKVALAYSQRNEYLLKLLSAKKNNAIKNDLETLNKLVFQEPASVDRVEILSSTINQKLAHEITEFTSSKKSNLFSSMTQIRSLEQYDRFIDLARTDYSNWTFEYMKKKDSLEKTHLFKSSLKDISYFKVDHMIRDVSK